MDFGRNIPQHRKLYEILRKHITEGVYKQGDLLPSENDLCATYHLTRPTVRQALSSLVNEGYIMKHQGKGSIVKGPSREIGILSISGTTSALGSTNLKTKVIRGPEIQPWEEDFMFPLESGILETGCIYVERLRLFSGKPIFYDINYLPNVNLPRFTSRNLSDKSLFDVLRKFYQVEIKGGEQRLKAIQADKKISNFLKVSKNHPVLHLERKLETNRPGYYIFSSIYCNTEDYSIYGTF